MAFLIYHGDKKNSCGELQIESSVPFEFSVVVPNIGSHLNLILNDNLIAKVNGTHIELHGEKLKIQRDGITKWGWVINNKLGIILYPNGDTYTLNNEVVAKVTRNGGLLQWLFQIVKTKSLRPYSSFIKLEYDESKIDPLLAICIHLVDVSNSFHTH